MARTVAGTPAPYRQIPAQPGPYLGVGACEFCRTKTFGGVRHDLCPGEIHTAPGKKDDKLWTCACYKEGHPS